MRRLSATITEAAYGEKIVLRDITIEAAPGEIVGLIGPNGSGKSTLLKAIAGLVQVRGTILLDGLSIADRSVRDRIRAGVGFLPQGQRVFVELTVRENLALGGCLLSGSELAGRREEVLQWFPDLKRRLGAPAAALSGGERQQLALARVIIQRPKVLLLDEPALGLATGLTVELLRHLQILAVKLQVTVIIAEQKVAHILRTASRVYGLRLGRTVAVGTAAEVGHDDVLAKIFAL